MKGNCVLCGADTDGSEMEFCFICENLPFICWECMAQHLTENHTQAQFMKAQQELTA